MGKNNENFIKEILEAGPKSESLANQQRNLHREQGGLEDIKEQNNELRPEDDQIAEVDTGKDIWDDRSQEVRDMAETVFETTGMRSVVNKQKKDRIKNKKNDDKSKDEDSVGYFANQQMIRNEYRNNSDNRGGGMTI